MSSTRSHGIWIALACLGASIALVVWWASVRTVASDDVVARENDPRSDSTEHARAELEMSELASERTIAASRVTEAAATTEPANDAKRPPGQIRLRLVDAQGQRLTRLKGFLGIERDPLTRVTSGAGSWHGGNVETSADAHPRRAWNVTIPESGEYVFEGLEFGRWNVDCQADGFRQASVDVLLLDATPHQEVDLVVPRQRTIEVSFRTPDGESFLAALKRASPRYADAVRPQLSLSVERGGSGFVTFTTEIGHARDATYWRTLRADSFESLTVSAFVADTLLASVDAPTGVESVTLVASVDAVEAALGTLTVVVVDQTTELPIARASVECRAGGVAIPTLVADENGRVEFGAVIGPKVSVSAVFDGYASTTQDVAITPRSRTETIVRLDRGVTIAGVLRAEDRSDGFDLAYLAAFDEGSSRGTFVIQPNRKPGRVFTFEHLPRGHYVLFTNAGTRSAGVKISSRLELQEPPDVAARNGRLPKGLVYVDARSGSVSNIVLVVPAGEPK